MNDASVPAQQSVRRAADVLFCFDAEHRTLSASDVAARLSMNRTTAWRYLRSLLDTGLVDDVGHGRFTLGARTLALAQAYSSTWADLEAVGGTALLRLRDSVGETAGLHLRQGWSRVVVRQVESRHELHRTYRELGQPISLLRGAPSLAILAALPLTARTSYLDSLEASEEPVDRPPLEQHLDRIRAAGFAYSRGARVPDVSSVAVSLVRPEGDVLGAINVTGPSERLPEHTIDEVAQHVVRAARWIEHQLAGSTTRSAVRE